MPDQNDAGGARQCSRVSRPVQVCGLLLLRALWLNRLQDRMRTGATTRIARLPEAT
jgi:hypothetical protein